ncbi:MAG: DUF5683 domain-containing protein [Paludibacter sp.]|nr:DUF5683 domain-containing protein [Paludibacter sp.]
MFEQLKIGLILLIASFPLYLTGQDNAILNAQDTVQSLRRLDLTEPLIVDDDTQIESVETEKFKPDPIRAIWLGAVIPGYGQIINRKYWKLPIVYGGFLGCFYAVNWNARQFLSYKNAYLDITDTDDSTNSYLEIIPPGFTIDSYGGKDAFTNLLKSGMDKSRYNRDLSIIISIAYYGLTLIDAFVDAHLYDFDISPDLSLKLRPSIINDRFTMNQLPKTSFSYGLKGSIKF